MEDHKGYHNSYPPNITSKAKGLTLALTMWQIWNFINQTHSNKPHTKESQIRNQIDRSILELMGKKEKNLNSYSALEMENHPSPTNWNPPPINVWKLNSDASWCKKTKKGGMGWVVRDSNRSLICIGLRRTLKNWSIKALEAKAMWEGMKFLHAKFGGNLSLEIESDALQLIKCLFG